MASDYISREWLMQTLGITSFDCEHCEWAEHFTYRCKRGGDFEDACCAIEDAPSADVRENVRGEWIDWSRLGLDGVYVWHRACSKCGYERDDDNIDKDSNFCPNCGCEMR